MEIIHETVLNIASTMVGTQMLGPGVRSVVWVMGCMLNCLGCISPEWLPLSTNRLVSPEILAQELLANPEVTGVTISGGEPMLQALAITSLIKELKKIRKINTICFTGYTYDHILALPPSSGIPTLLNELDLLIDGPYIQKLNDDKGMRGSSNQRIIHLSRQLMDYEFENIPRKAELVIQNGYLHLVGVPDSHLKQALDDFDTTRDFTQPARLINVRP